MTTFLPLVRDDVLTIYETNGAAMVEVCSAKLRPLKPAELASLVANLTPYLMAPRRPVVELGDVTISARPVAADHRAGGRVAEVRAIVAANPGITRAEVLRALGLTNPSGTQWATILARAGVVSVPDELSGRPHYYVDDSAPAPAPKSAPRASRHQTWRESKRYEVIEGHKFGGKTIDAYHVIRDAGPEGIRSQDVLTALGLVGHERRSNAWNGALRRAGLVRVEGQKSQARYYYVPESERGHAPEATTG